MQENLSLLYVESKGADQPVHWPGLQIFFKIGGPKPRGGGGTLIFSYIQRLRSFFGVQNFEFQYFWRFSEQLIFFGV